MIYLKKISTSGNYNFAISSTFIKKNIIMPEFYYYEDVIAVVGRNWNRHFRRIYKFRFMKKYFIVN